MRAKASNSRAAICIYVVPPWAHMRAQFATAESPPRWLDIYEQDGVSPAVDKLEAEGAEGFWQQVVRYYRSGESCNDPLGPILNDLDYIRGPWADGELQGKYTGWPAIGTVCDQANQDPIERALKEPNTEQICIKSERFANYTNQHLVAQSFHPRCTQRDQ